MNDSITDTLQDPFIQMKENREWFKNHREEIFKRYSGKYIIIYQKKILYHDSSFERTKAKLIPNAILYGINTQEELIEDRVFSPYDIV